MKHVYPRDNKLVYARKKAQHSKVSYILQSNVLKVVTI